MDVVPVNSTALGLGVLLLFSAPLLRFLYRAALFLRAYWILRHVPRHRDGTWSNLLIGAAKDVVGPHAHRILTERMHRLGPVIYSRLLCYQVVFLSDPSMAAELLHNRELEKASMIGYNEFRTMLNPAFHADLVTAEGGPSDVLYKAVRKGIAPAFSTANLRLLYPQLAKVGRAFLEALRERASRGALDVSNALMCETIDALGICGFGHDFGSIDTIASTDQNELLKTIFAANQEMEARMSNPWRSLLWFLPHVRRSFAPVLEFRRIMRGILEELKARGEPAESDVSMGAHLLRLRDPATGAPLEDGMLQAQLSVLIWAGFDTTGNTMAWTLYLISQHPQVEARIVAELEGLQLLASPTRPRPADVSYDDLSRLPYLTAVIKESMRLITVVGTVTGRISLHKDLTLGGGRLVVPKRTAVWVPLMPLHLSPANWEEPNEFRPERFLKPGAEYALPRQNAGAPQATNSKAPPTASSPNSPAAGQLHNGAAERPKRFMPFSDGRRDCIGQAFARLNYTSNLARLLAHFSFRLDARMGGPVGVRALERMALTLLPGAGLWMQAVPRAGP